MARGCGPNGVGNAGRTGFNRRHRGHRTRRSDARRGLARAPLSSVFYRPRCIRLLSVDSEWIRGLKAKLWKSRTLPIYTMNTERLYQSLIREYLFVSLFRAFAESLASENAARLASMQVAERNIEDRLRELSSEFRQSRQAAVTSELLDIVSAFEALKGAAR